MKNQMPSIARGQKWLFQPLPLSDVLYTGRSLVDIIDRGLDEEELSDVIES